MNREDFPILKKDIIYFDNSATTLKPNDVIKAVNDYYTKYTANAHRGDYKNSLKVDMLYEETRELVKDFINASRKEEIVFTYGATDSLNMIANGFFKNILKKGDEILITKTEHASNVLPWLELEKEIGVKVKYAPLDKDLKLTLETLKKAITKKTKVVALAHVTNTIGDVRDIEEIGNYLGDDIYFVVDAAQSAGHKKVDVQKSNIDFLAFSGHKMLGPTGVGVLYGKYNYLKKMKPTRVGGGMNASFESDGNVEYKLPPFKFEAGTGPVAEVIGLRSAIIYLNKIGLDKIQKHEKELRDYLLKELETIKDVEVINKNTES